MTTGKSTPCSSPPTSSTTISTTAPTSSTLQPNVAASTPATIFSKPIPPDAWSSARVQSPNSAVIFSPATFIASIAPYPALPPPAVQFFSSTAPYPNSSGGCPAHPPPDRWCPICFVYAWTLALRFSPPDHAKAKESDESSEPSSSTSCSKNTSAVLPKQPKQPNQTKQPPSPFLTPYRPTSYEELLPEEDELDMPAPVIEPVFDPDPVAREARLRLYTQRDDEGLDIFTGKSVPPSERFLTEHGPWSKTICMRNKKKVTKLRSPDNA